MISPRLVDLQRAFHALATGGDAAGWSAADLVHGDTALSAAARMDVYARMYVDRLVDVLAQDYPKLRAWLGCSAFRQLAIEYVRAVPPRHCSVTDAGRQLPPYLADRGDLPPWLCDLARVERARVDVFDAADCQTLGHEDLERLAPADAPTLLLRLVPASTIVPIAYSVDELWDAIEDDRSVVTPSATVRTVLSWRRDLLVVHRTLDADEAKLASLLSAGTTFADLCEELATAVEQNEAPSRAAALLVRWAEAGILQRT